MCNSFELFCGQGLCFVDKGFVLWARALCASRSYNFIVFHFPPLITSFSFVFFSTSIFAGFLLSTLNIYFQSFLKAVKQGILREN